MYPPPEPPSPQLVTLLQIRLMKKLGRNAYPFTFSVCLNVPPYPDPLPCAPYSPLPSPLTSSLSILLARHPPQPYLIPLPSSLPPSTTYPTPLPSSHILPVHPPCSTSSPCSQLRTGLPSSITLQPAQNGGEGEKVDCLQVHMITDTYTCCPTTPSTLIFSTSVTSSSLSIALWC